MPVCGGIDIVKPTSIGGMNRWYFTCKLKGKSGGKGRGAESDQGAPHRSDQGDEVVEKSSAERRASRTRRNGCGAPP